MWVVIVATLIWLVAAAGAAAIALDSGLSNVERAFAGTLGLLALGMATVAPVSTRCALLRFRTGVQ